LREAFAQKDSATSDQVSRLLVRKKSRRRRIRSHQTHSTRQAAAVLSLRSVCGSLISSVQAILDLVNEAANHKQIKKGANEGE
jgi:hypothetical protein